LSKAFADHLDDWSQWLRDAQDGLNLGWAVLIFTDTVAVERLEGAEPAEWLCRECGGHASGDLLEARIFGDTAEALVRREDENEWLCRLVTDDDGHEGGTCLHEGSPATVFLWGQRLKDTPDTWFEQRVKPVKLPLDNKGDLAAAEIVVYERDSGLPLWRFKSLTTKGEGAHGHGTPD